MLLVAFAAMVFVSCSDDDDDNVTPFGGKQISKITYTDNDDGEIESYTYDYDKQGRIISESAVYSQHESDLTTYTYETNKITEKIINAYSGNTHIWQTVYTLDSKGRIISSINEREETNIYSYDDKGQLIKISGEDNIRFTWENGNLTKVEWNGYTTKYTYNRNENKNIGINYFSENMPNNILFNYGYFGAKNKNLMASTQEDSDSPYTNEYEFDKNGNVTTMKEYRIENGTKTLKTTVIVEYK